MTEQVFVDVFGEEVLMTETVRLRTLEKHPEAQLFIDLVPQVLGTPDQVKRSNHDERGILYYLYRQDILEGKWLVVVVKQVDRKYVSTVYATNKIKSGELLWIK